jgi:hypothetical protein
VENEKQRDLALEGISVDDAAEMCSQGWRIVSARDLVKPEVYRDYIRSSLGEFTVTKDQYVRPRSGWFSDRSVCYLAAGRPVVTQETGFSRFIPTGEGLFAFSTEEHALAAIEPSPRTTRVTHPPLAKLLGSTLPLIAY